MMMVTGYFNEGLQARRNGASFADVPYYSRTTALGTRVPDERGIDWQAGWSSFQRRADAKELAAADAMDIGKFRRKSNRYYA